MVFLNYSMIMQSILQVFGIYWIKICCGKNLPRTHDYQGKIAYSLPFADGVVVEVYNKAKDSNIMGNGRVDYK